MKKLSGIFILLLLPLTVILATNTKEQSFVNNYAKALQMKHNGNLKEAISRFNKLLKPSTQYGFEPEIRIHLAECKFRLGRMSDAIADLEKVNKLIEKNSEYKYLKDYVNFQLGLLYYVIGRSFKGGEVLSSTEDKMGGEAVKEYLRFVSLRSGRLGINKGDSLDVRKIRAKLEVTIEKLDKYEPDILKLLLARSYTFYPPKKITDINNILSDINIQKYNSNFEAVVEYTRGEMWFVHSQYNTSKMKFEEFLKRYRGNRLNNFVKYYLAYVDYIIGSENADTSMIAKAQQEFSDVSNPNISGTNLAYHAKYFMGECARRRGEIRQAERAFEDVRNSFPNSQFDFLATFRIYQIRKNMEKDTTKIERELQRLQNITPKMFSSSGRVSEKGLYLTALSLYENKQYQEAYNLLDENFIQQESKKSDVVYEAGLTLSILSALRLLVDNNPNTNINLSTAWFLDRIKGDIPKDGTMWRGRMIYSLGDYFYLRNDKEEAERLYKMLIDDTVYSFTTIHFLARASYAWIKMERGEYDTAMDEFNNAFLHSSNASTLVLAAYGLGLANYLKGNHMQALPYFKVIKVGERDPNPGLYDLLEEKRGVLIKGNELSQQILDDNLWYLGQTYEALNSYLDAIDVYKYLVDHYPQGDRSADASQRVVDIFALAAVSSYNGGDVTSASKYIQNARSYFENYVVRYRDQLGQDWPGYCRSLSVLQQAYMTMQNNDAAEKFAERISKECGVSDVLEVYYYQQALTSLSTPDIEDKIDKVIKINRYSKYLPDMYWHLLKQLLQEEQRDYRKIINVGEELRAWPDQTLIPDLPYVLLTLGVAYTQLDKQDEAIRTFRQLVDEYPDYNNTPKAMYTLATLLFDKADKLRQNGRSLDYVRKFYQDARRYFSILLKKYPTNPYVERNKDTIKNYITIIDQKLR